MWIAFNTKKDYENGEYDIAYDGLVVSRVKKTESGWFSLQGQRINREDIFYISIPEPVSYVELVDNVQYRYFMTM